MKFIIKHTYSVLLVYKSLIKLIIKFISAKLTSFYILKFWSISNSKCSDNKMLLNVK